MVNNTGGPAFPVQVKFFDKHTTGMSLRDYFAAKAMDGFNRHMVSYEWGEDVTEYAAKRAYEIADAMLKTREQK